MAVVINACSDGGSDVQLSADYKFEFVITKASHVPTTVGVLSSTFNRKGDGWQLELTKVNGNSPLRSKYNCKLRLISDTSDWKITHVEMYQVREFQIFGTMKRKTVLCKSGDFQFNVGTVHILSGTLTISVEVVNCTEAKPNPTRIIPIPKSTLSVEVLKWFESEDFGNITIVAADGKTFQCHQDILSARSEVFHSMFNSKMKEEREKVVNMEDFNGEIVDSLLSFIYADEIAEIGPIADRLYAAAHQYQLDLLKNLCESELVANLKSKVAAVKIIQLAQFYNLSGLKTKCIDYLVTLRSGTTKKSTASKTARGPKVKRSGLVEPTGLAITERDNSDSYGNDCILPVCYSFAFTINNISKLEKVVFSDSFTHKGDVWQMELERSGRKDVRCKLHLVETSSEEPKVACVTYVGDTDYCEPYCTRCCHAYGRRLLSIDIHTTTPVALFHHSGDSYDFGLLNIRSENDDAKLEVALVTWEYAETPAQPKPSNPQLATEVLKWFQTEEFGDATVVASDGHKFRCHRDILARRSEVFRQKFSSDATEAGENVVNIEDFDGEIVAALMAFVYTDECGKIGPIADRLYVAAVHYQLERLKILCESSLAVSLSADSITKSFRLANYYHLDQLMSACLDYLEVHKAVLPVGKIVAEVMKIGDGK